MAIRDRAVSRTFRQGLADALPGLGNHRAYWRMTQLLIFGTRRDAHTGFLMIPATVIAEIEAVEYDQHYCAQRFLDAYRRDVMGFEIEEYVLHPNPDLCRCRAVRSINLPPTVQTLVDAERRRYNKSDERVWMSTGSLVLPRHVIARRKAEQEEASALAQAESVLPESARLIEYLNHLAPNRFTSALNHLPEAMEAAHGLADADNQLNLLMAIRDDAMPLYVPCAKSTRITSMNESVLRLHRDLRKIMTQDWITADLRSAQLAIVARIWQIPTLTDYLESGVSVWADLCAHMGLEYTPENKAIMKGILYPTVFGAGKKKMKLLLAASFDNATAALRRWLSHPVAACLIRARERIIDQIRRDSGMLDAFGRMVPLTLTPFGNGSEGTYDDVLTVMAVVAQSFELALLMPVISLAIEQQFCSHGFTITTFLHDGLTFDCHDKSDAETWKERLRGLVKAQAEALGICSELEF